MNPWAAYWLTMLAILAICAGIVWLGWKAYHGFILGKWGW